MGVSAQYVKMSFAGGVGDINHGDTSWWGLNEVRFYSAAALAGAPVPEPSVLAILATGLLVIFSWSRVARRGCPKSP
jgi:hypothetical protein